MTTPVTICSGQLRYEGMMKQAERTYTESEMQARLALLLQQVAEHNNFGFDNHRGWVCVCGQKIIDGLASAKAATEAQKQHVLSLSPDLDAALAEHDAALREVADDLQQRLAASETDETLRTQIDELISKLNRSDIRASKAERQLAELQSSLDLIHDSDMRGIKMWQEATGKTDTWPDRGKMIFWLLEKLSGLREPMACGHLKAFWHEGYATTQSVEKRHAHCTVCARENEWKDNIERREQQLSERRLRRRMKMRHN